MLEIGSKAVDFNLDSTSGEKVSLNSLKGKKVLLTFYPADWSPVCSDELSIINQALPLLGKYNVTVLGISVDGKWSHLEFSKNRALSFQLLSDFEPKGEVSKLYDAYNKEGGFSERAFYLIDEEGIIKWSHLSPKNINPGVDGVLNALDELSRG